MSKLRIGFVGGGINSAVGNAHYAACRLDGRFEVVAGFFSRDDETNNASAEKYDAKAVNSLDELMRYGVDVVAILTPTPTHYELVKACLLAGMPVICEKALAATAEEALELVDLKNEKQGWLAVTYNYTGYPIVRELQYMIKNGGLGKILSVQAEMPQEGYLREGAKPQEWRLKDGVIPAIHLDLGTHLHHLISFVTGDFPIGAFGKSHKYSDFDVVDNVSCLAEYSTGFSANLWFGKTALGFRNGLKIRVNGTHASAEWVQTNPEELIVATNKGQRGIIDRSSPESLIASQPRYQRFKAGHPEGYIPALANVYYDFADSLENSEAVSFYYSPEIACAGLDMMTTLANQS